MTSCESAAGRSDLVEGDPPVEVARYAPGCLPALCNRAAAGAVLVLYGSTRHRDAQALIGAPLFPPTEIARAARFRRCEDRDEYLLARALARMILSYWLDAPPAEVPFSAAARFEKPRLQRPLAGKAVLDVSLSHAGGWVACAVARGRDVGVDVELDRPGLAQSLDGLAAQILTPKEAEGFRAVGAAGRQALFLEFWRRKEALMKAAGLGFSGGPERARVADFAHDGAVAWRSHVRFAGRLWRVRSADAEPGVPIALAFSCPAPAALSTETVRERP